MRSASDSLRLKPRPHQQQCKSNVRLCRSNFRLCCQNGNSVDEFIVKFRIFDQVYKSNIASTLLPFLATMFAVFGNNVERNFVISTKSKQIDHIQFVSTLSKGRNFVRHCCRNRQHCCQKRQQCPSNIPLCLKNRSTCSIRLIASTLLLVLTGL